MGEKLFTDSITFRSTNYTKKGVLHVVGRLPVFTVFTKVIISSLVLHLLNCNNNAYVRMLYTFNSLILKILINNS